jgi:ATP-dependent Lhr-like helicase
MNNVLELFDPITARWFAQVIGTPTAVQEEAWPAIASGGHTLVSAPTGTGKTLSAFLVFIDRLLKEKRAGTLPQELRLIYVSPLKSLAGDIRENLRRPLDGILKEQAGSDAPVWPPPEGLTVAVRTGDTPQNERRRMIKTPPNLLIITPESLYLMLTSKSGQAMLKTAQAVIIDELHAMIDTKRGAHLMLTLARLDRLCGRPLQRIGLSATIEPLTRAAAYLSPDPDIDGGAAAVAIVSPKMKKDIKLEVVGIPEVHLRKDNVWQDIADAVYARCQNARSTIAFVDGRAYAEKLAFYVNQRGGDGFARTHHGSLSRQQRFEVETALRGGTLNLLCATSSMELGIDVGEIDLVFQIGCPRSISSTMQRLGRAGHKPGRTSVMSIFTRAPGESLYSGLAAEVVRQGGIEYCRPPRLCLDVLAQHLVSMAATEDYSIDDVMGLLPHAYPFREVTREDVQAVLGMLAGDYEHERDVPARPRLLYDRIHGKVAGDPYSRILAVSAGGTIPDRGLHTVKTDTGVTVGELDEENVYESRVGDKFLLGTFAWQIAEIRKDMVIVRPTTKAGVRPPFYHGDITGRRLQTGLAYGRLLRRLGDAQEAGRLPEDLEALGLDEAAVKGAKEVVARQIASTGCLPDDGTVLVEHFRDDAGIRQIMVHAVFGRPVNEPLAILAAKAAKSLTGKNINYVVDDDGFLLFPYEDCAMPEGLLQTIAPDTARAVLSAVLPVTPVFNMAFRYNAGRALMMGVRKSGRQPLWLQRMRGAEMLDSVLGKPGHPLIRETLRECLEDYWDLPGVTFVMDGIRAGTIRVREVTNEIPSPMSFLLRRQTEASMMYDYAPTTDGIRAASHEALQAIDMIAPDPTQLALVQSGGRSADSEARLHSLMMIEGDLIAGDFIASDFAAGVSEAPIEWLESLEKQDRVLYIEPGLWIAAEHQTEYDAALQDGDGEARSRIVRRLLRYRGAQTPELVAERYLWPESAAAAVLEALREAGSAVLYDGLYYHAELFGRAQRETIKARRSEAKTLPPERYAALLAARAFPSGTAEERLEAALETFSGLTYPAAVWEDVLLPARTGDYRPSILDSVLAQGKYYWKVSQDGGLSFGRYADIDWDADMSGAAEGLSGNDKAIVEALAKSGASFAQRFTGLVAGESPSDVLNRLLGLGLVTADSFVPVRQWLHQGKINPASTRQKIRSRVLTVTAGRWDLVRPAKALTMEEQLERLFDRAVIICRETAQELGWQNALNTLRVWEYIGRVRRGYFIEGLSGMQFVRDKDFAGVTHAFEHPDDHPVWLSAMDPAQPWGKVLPHRPGCSFMNIPGTAVALRSGVPAAVFERQGHVLRVFNDEALDEMLRAFVLDYNRRRLFSHALRLTLKEYPPEAQDALKSAGFVREMQDYVLYRGEK